MKVVQMATIRLGASIEVKSFAVGTDFLETLVGKVVGQVDDFVYLILEDGSFKSAHLGSCRLRSGDLEDLDFGRPISSTPNVVHAGKNMHRLSANEFEKRFYETWNNINLQSHILDYLLGEGNRRESADWDQRELAATVIQWLGSPVGQGFLEDVGFVPKG